MQIPFFTLLSGAFILTASTLLGQLTAEQKSIDLQTVASLYAKQYAPYEWKRDKLGFDLFDLRPWLERARQTKTDLEYLDLLTEYTASLQDIHSYYITNSTFAADLHLYADIYDGKVRIEVIDRAYLPARIYDFGVGDEIVQIDGRPVLEVVQEIGKLSSFANLRSTQRWAADLLVYRQQAYLPRTAELADNAVILVRRQNGAEKTYTIPWDKTGTPLTKLGPLPNFRLNRGNRRSVAPSGTADESKPPQPEELAPDAPPTPAYLKPWLSLQRHKVTRPVRTLRGFSQRNPIYRLPAGFTQRLGRLNSDYFYSGAYTAGEKRIGFIRIGTFDPVDFSLLGLPLRQFEQEIAYMKANTDVLVVDITRNGGGYACYAEELEKYLIAKPFTGIGVEIRPNLDIIRDFELSVQDAQDYGEEWEARLMAAITGDVKTAYSENRGRTGPLPLCSLRLDQEPIRDRNGAVLAYDKPILLLTDEFSTSAADAFAATLQDAHAATLFGFRTAGAGGNTVTTSAGFYSEGSAAVTQMLTVRPTMQNVPGFGATRYIENTGVRPDIEYDYQTLDNLLDNGASFVDAFTKAAAALVPSAN